jgi:hypothetical protein
MDKEVTPTEAFLHFLGNCPKPVPADVHEAKYAMQGKRTYKLGDRRIKTLLEKYAPERYEFMDVVIIKE